MGWWDFGWEDLVAPEEIGPPPWERFDLGAGEALGPYDMGLSAGEAYDFGQIEVPAWAGWPPTAFDFSGGEPNAAFAPEIQPAGAFDFSGGEPNAPLFAGEQGYTYNTTTGAVSGPGGQPLPLGAAAGVAGGVPGAAGAGKTLLGE